MLYLYMANPLQNRNESILQRRFIELTLNEAASDWEATNQRLFNKFNFKSGDIQASQSFVVNDNTLTYEHLIKTRFIDMKRLGGVKKKSFPIHNKVILGYFYQIIKDLRVGYTEAVRSSLNQPINIEM